MTHLQSCDLPVRGTVNSRGTLSEDALTDFVEFFLETCIGQIDFMSELTQPRKLHDRLLAWANEEMRAGALPPGSDAVLTAVLVRGELARAEVATLLGASERSARRLTAALIRTGVTKSKTSRSSLRLAFPVGLAKRFLPGLLPED